MKNKSHLYFLFYLTNKKNPTYIFFVTEQISKKLPHTFIWNCAFIRKSRVMRFHSGNKPNICLAESRSFTVTWQARIWLVEVWEKYVKMNIFSTIFPEKRKGKSSKQHRRPIKLAKLAQLGSRHR